MKYLLDTSVWLRAYFQPETIPAPSRRILASSAQIFGLSAISLWEVGKKYALGKLTLDRDLDAWFRRAVVGNIELMPLTPEIVVDAMRLPAFPNHDPADEIIVATARVHRLTLLTTDRGLRNYHHATISYFAPRSTA